MTHPTRALTTIDLPTLPKDGLVQAAGPLKTIYWLDGRILWLMERIEGQAPSSSSKALAIPLHHVSGVEIQIDAQPNPVDPNAMPTWTRKVVLQCPHGECVLSAADRHVAAKFEEFVDKVLAALVE